MSPMIRIAMLDDQPAVRAGLEAIIASEPDLQLVGSAGGDAELWPLLRRTRPDVLVLDLYHGGRDGLALTLKVRRLPDRPAIVLYTGSARGPLVVAGLVAGADAVVSKTSSGPALVEAIRHAAASTHAPMPVSREMRVEAAARLDPADHAILAMRLAGEPPAEIADTLGLTDRAIEQRIARIVRRLEPSARAA
jgi:DNA-binding NarL/FixJ family response regulator